jgi:hypothetical protein
MSPGDDGKYNKQEHESIECFNDMFYFLFAEADKKECERKIKIRIISSYAFVIDN